MTEPDEKDSALDASVDHPADADAEVDVPGPTDGSLRARGANFWRTHRTLLWSLHSVWALFTGVVVIVLARERYGFIPWVVVFLAVTWASTMYFGRRTSKDAAEDIAADEDEHQENRVRTPGLAEEVSSYLTRTLYQETLFFLLPFYVYSAVMWSWNVAFVGLLAGLAIFSCIDLVFDRWLRTRPVFGLIFFATVAFAALNLLLPIVLHREPALSTRLAAILSVASSIPLALRGAADSRGAAWRLAAAGIVILGIPIAMPALVPPVPIRMESATFANEIDRSTLTLTEPLQDDVSASRLGGRLVMLAQVFAPTSIPARVTIEWKRNGQVIRTSREVAVTAHGGGFRIWDGWAPGPGAIEAGEYQVVLRTAGRRVFGVVGITVTE